MAKTGDGAGAKRQAAKIVEEKKPRSARFGPDRKPRSVMFDAPSRDAHEFLVDKNPGGFNLTRWFNRALQEEAMRQGWIPPSEDKK